MYTALGCENATPTQCEAQLSPHPVTNLCPVMKVPERGRAATRDKNLALFANTNAPLIPPEPKPRLPSNTTSSKPMYTMEAAW